MNQSADTGFILSNNCIYGHLIIAIIQNQNHMNMIWHNNVFIYVDTGIMFFQFQYGCFCNFSKPTLVISGTKEALLVMGTYCYEIIIWCGIVILRNTCTFSFLKFHILVYSCRGGSLTLPKILVYKQNHLLLNYRYLTGGSRPSPTIGYAVISVSSTH